MPLLIGGALIGGSLISGYLGNKAAKSQSAAAGNQIDEARRQFEITRKDTEPYRQVGVQNLNRLAELMSGGKVTPEMMGPGYQFRVSEGQKGVQNYLNRIGMKRSGRAMKEMERFGQGIASDEFGNYFNRLGMLAGFGPQGVAQSAGAGARLAGSPGYAGQYMAAGAGPAAINNAIQGGLSNYFAYRQNQQLLNALGGMGQVPGDAYMPAARFG